MARTIVPSRSMYAVADGPRGARPVGVVALLHGGRLGVGGLVQAGEDRRLPAPPGAARRVAVGLVGQERRDRRHLTPLQNGRGLEPEEREDRAQEGQEDPGADVVVGDGDVEDEEDDQDERERRSRADPGRGVDVGPAAVRASSPRSSPMPAQSVDPRIDEQREHEAVEGAAHDDAGEEGQDELDPAHRAVAGLTARTYPGSHRGNPGVGVDRTSAPSCPKRAGGGPRFLVGRLGHASHVRPDHLGHRGGIGHGPAAPRHHPHGHWGTLAIIITLTREDRTSACRGGPG